MSQDFLVGVDVGTGSARAGIFTRDGKLLGRHENPILMRREDANFAEHDSSQIWSAVCAAVRGAMAAAGADPAAIAGIAFDATCSLVVRDGDGEPVTVSRNGEDRWDTIVWLDHRALDEAEQCTRTGHEVLDYIGGVMSPEMEVPKLMWLKRHLPQSWQRAGMMFDLADFLSWKATGSLARSQCTLATKWTYAAHQAIGWKEDFLTQVGLEDLVAKASLPEKASPIGADLGPLTPIAAEQLGLTTRCRVGAGLIDAYAGTLAELGPLTARPEEMDRHSALIAGTSSCVMSMSRQSLAVKGIWGPHLGTILDGYWQLEGGQSASGALLDHILRWHGAGGEPSAQLHQAICDRVMELRAEAGPAFASRLHVLPDFHGNRSPLGDPNALGVISGLTLDSDFDSLCRLYWRSCVGIALGIRHILETMSGDRSPVEYLHVIGGHTKNPLLMELYADATGCIVIEPNTPDATLLGMAMVAANAAGLYPSLDRACLAMHRSSTQRHPNPAMRPQFDRDYRIFLEMLKQRQAIDALE
ncbi:FGGY-family carbohydrate kinase [Devosia sp. YIM 151766]|uniref:FGGY-family carbohydrate kinase n=1 Tax=Devosia sp. YIM 151766 TaxID=3017325 RepID=UPI00255D0EDF|nr:FGGY-family carbohydrate kinase [Devosia sp. YIM 151766]WIY51939.1 FGGY-family carbohydrate kinase [Devosia sp. YIM 151766]